MEWRDPQTTTNKTCELPLGAIKQHKTGRFLTGRLQASQKLELYGGSTYNKNPKSTVDLVNIRISNSLQWLWSTPYTSKHLLRRYLDHPKTKTPSTEVFGCLGSVTYKCEHQKILRRLPLNRRWCGLHFGGFRVGLTSKNPNVCFVCFVCLVLFWLVGWLVVLFCFFGQSMGTCFSKPPQEITHFWKKPTNSRFLVSDLRIHRGFRLDHLFKKIVLGVASLGGYRLGFFWCNKYTPVFFSCPGKV